MKRKTIANLLTELQQAYVRMTNAGKAGPDYRSDFDRMTGEYIGLRRAYSLVTGKDRETVGHEVVVWYVKTHPEDLD